MPTHELGGEEGGDLGMRIVDSPVPSAEKRLMTTVSDYCLSLPTIALHL